MRAFLLLTSLLAAALWACGYIENHSAAASALWLMPWLFASSIVSGTLQLKKAKT